MRAQITIDNIRIGDYVSKTPGGHMCLVLDICDAGNRFYDIKMLESCGKINICYGMHSSWYMYKKQ